ncbi:MAG: hypothetical protein QW505_05190 [Thermoplasmata archaeon]
MNSSIDAYLSSLDRKMFWMNRKTRKDILREVKSHLSERIAAGESPETVIKSFGSADAVAKEYLRIYGFGAGFIFVLSAITFLFSIFTVPGVLSLSYDYLGMDWGAMVFLVLTILIVLLTAYKGGRKAGVIAGAVGCVARFVVLGALILTGGAIVQDATLGAIGFALISILLPVIGYLSSVKPIEREAGI